MVRAHWAGRMSARDRFLATAATLLVVATGAGACAHTDYFPGTTILRNEENIKIIETVEQ
jgi:hypothetical protein